MEHDSMPPVIGVEELAKIMGKSPATIMADRVRAPDRVPPACIPPGSRIPRWILSDVIAWLRQFQEIPAPQENPETKAGDFDPAPAAAPRKRGRPSKAELATQRRNLAWTGSKTFR